MPPASVSSQYTRTGQTKGAASTVITAPSLVLEQLQRCARALRHFQAEMLVGVAGGDAAARGAHHEALLDQIRLDHVLDRAALLAERRCEALDADRTAVELLDDRQQELAVHHVEAERVDVEHVEGRLGHFVGDAAAGLYFRKVAHAP